MYRSLITRLIRVLAAREGSRRMGRFSPDGKVLASSVTIFWQKSRHLPHRVRLSEIVYTCGGRHIGFMLPQHRRKKNVILR
ncbi:MAG: hypothetical protein IJX93_01440, partial [Clostridia bacterium]|nr:hypothetical protein [Clostridia bacterium]